MKKEIILGLCICNILNSMEKEPLTPRTPLLHNIKEAQVEPALRSFSEVGREPREWDAQAYDEGNTIQTEAFLQFLATNKINFTDRTILDVACGTGKIAARLASRAAHIHGFDASKNMIDFAQKQYGTIENLSFEQSFAEDFSSQRLYQLAFASCCIHWFYNQKRAFQHIHGSLEHGGDFFATVQTRDNPTPPELIAAQEMIEGMAINKAYKYFAGKDLIDLTECTLPSAEELKNMLESVGFTILKSEQQSYFFAMTKDEVKKTERPIVFSRPIMKYIPNILAESLFNDYIDIYLSKLQKVGDDKYLEQIITTVVHARKK
jgi:trans-aconitate methyltransferase